VDLDALFGVNAGDSHLRREPGAAAASCFAVRRHRWSYADSTGFRPLAGTVPARRRYLTRKLYQSPGRPGRFTTGLKPGALRRTSVAAGVEDPRERGGEIGMASSGFVILDVTYPALKDGFASRIRSA
jgi:hypothetical protein